MPTTATPPKPRAGSGATDGGSAGAKDGAKKGKGKLLVVVALVLVLAAGGYWFEFVHGASHSGKKAAPKPPALGAVLDVDPISINLAGGHYLKVGISLQEVKGAKDVTSGSRALDATIALFSGQQMAALQDPAKRDALKAQLVTTVKKDYDDEVVDVYFTEYVMQ